MKSIQFETTTHCNARCSFCPRYEMTRPMGMMKEELFKKIITQGKQMGYKYYYPFLNGEPFIFPKFYEWLDYMEKEGVFVAIYTNAELMDVDRILKYKNIFHINCSVNAATKETHEKIMRGPNFDRVVKNVEDLIARHSDNMRITVGMVPSPEVEHEIDLFKKKWGKYANIPPYANWTGARPEEKKNTKVRRHCRRIFNKITILWDGRVNLCCMDYDGKLIFGDLNKEDLWDIEKKKDWIKKLHKQNIYTMVPCNTCNYNTM